jgi:DNA topoisomerase-1
MSNLVIVESPAKAKTIQKYLGDDFEVMASMGHVRDLPKSKLGVDIENGFAPIYEAIKGKENLVSSLTKAAGARDKVYLATDPDREGEAISWHLADLLGLDLAEANRVTFNEITKSGIANGMAHPRRIDLDLVNAQQTRRILDRIVGYKLSPFLWRKVRKGLSAGRVQSVAVRLIVDREDLIRAFVSEEYWTVEALLSVSGGRAFEAHLHSKGGVKLEPKNAAEADALVADIKDRRFLVSEVKKSVRKKSPPPPFITSTLQQDASRRLGFQARRTMKVAQELYEGIELAGTGAVGLITYMRTDSLRISAEAADEAAAFIRVRYSEEYLPPSRRVYRSRGGAQDAHEAIRPTMPSLTPEQARSSLTADQYKLYKLIWERFIASQMANALLDTMSVDIAAGDYLFKASGYSVRFDGYTVLYEESRDNGEEGSGAALPPLETGDGLALEALQGIQHFTQPPPRFTEASIIKALEENGIGRPSTYAPIITTVLQRGYIEREGKALRPTLLGETITKLMKEQFADIVDVEFTARMEQGLDEVEEGKADWVRALEAFYDGFEKALATAEENLKGTRVKVPDEETDVICELCGRKMVIKVGRFGKFLACPGFPECKNTKKITQETGGLCPLCGGKVLAKKSKNGKNYFGCEHNPTCGFMTWDTPLAETCPQCGATLYKKMGRGGSVHCKKEGCGYVKTEDKPAKESAAAKSPKNAKAPAKAGSKADMKAKSAAKGAAKAAKPADKKKTASSAKKAAGSKAKAR